MEVIDNINRLPLYFQSRSAAISVAMAGDTKKGGANRPGAFNFSIA